MTRIGETHLLGKEHEFEQHRICVLNLSLIYDKSLNVSKPQLPHLKNDPVLPFHKRTKLDAAGNMYNTGTEQSLNVNPLAWQWPFWWIRMKRKLKFLKPTVIPPWHDFCKRRCTTGRIEKEEDDNIHFKEPAHLVKKWIRGRDCKFQAGALRVVILKQREWSWQETQLAGGEMGSFILNTQNMNIWEDVSQWK